MKNSFESEPKKGIAGKFWEVAMAALFAVGVGSGAEKAPNNPAEKGSKPAAEFKIENPKMQYEAIKNEVVKSGPDTFKTDGNISMVEVIEDMTGEKASVEGDDSEKFKVHKSGPDTLKSDEYKR